MPVCKLASAEGWSIEFSSEQDFVQFVNGNIAPVGAKLGYKVAIDKLPTTEFHTIRV